MPDQDPIPVPGAAASHYTTLRDQLKEDIRAVVFASMPVIFGDPRREIRGFVAFVETECERRNYGEDAGPRIIAEYWSFEIEVRMPLPDPYPEDGHEQTAMAYGNALSYQLVPYSLTDVPATAPAAYGGVGMKQHVSHIRALKGVTDSQPWIGFHLTFGCMTQAFR